MSLVGPSRRVNALERAICAFMESGEYELNVLGALCERLGARVFDAPDSEDFLGWHAGTMEYWIHALIAAEARRLGAWASRTEVPYMTTAASEAR